MNLASKVSAAPAAILVEMPRLNEVKLVLVIATFHYN